MTLVKRCFSTSRFKWSKKFILTLLSHLLVNYLELIKTKPTKYIKSQPIWRQKTLKILLRRETWAKEGLELSNIQLSVWKRRLMTSSSTTTKNFSLPLVASLDLLAKLMVSIQLKELKILHSKKLHSVTKTSFLTRNWLTLHMKNFVLVKMLRKTLACSCKNVYTNLRKKVSSINSKRKQIKLSIKFVTSVKNWDSTSHKH